ncbi:MAG: hypothetical protein IKP60_06755 [Treponema sp.]|nr:hypothetical protein [Treponema sp.]
MVVVSVLAFVSNSRSILSVLSGTFLSSVIFTLFGLIIATKITSLNQFILTTVPVEILGFVPALLHLFGVTPYFLGIYPANTCMDLIAGKDFSTAGLFLILKHDFHAAVYFCFRTVDFFSLEKAEYKNKVNVLAPEAIFFEYNEHACK